MGIDSRQPQQQQKQQLQHKQQQQQPPAEEDSFFNVDAHIQQVDRTAAAKVSPQLNLAKRFIGCFCFV